MGKEKCAIWDTHNSWSMKFRRDLKDEELDDFVDLTGLINDYMCINDQDDKLLWIPAMINSFLVKSARQSCFYRKYVEIDFSQMDAFVVTYFLCIIEDMLLWDICRGFGGTME